jgi:hypothetical protein
MRHFYTELQRLPEREFYADDFAEIARLAREAAESMDRPLPFFVLWSIFLLLDREWRERPLRMEVADRMKRHLSPSVERYLRAAESGLSPEAEAEHLNEIVECFLSWLQIQRDIPWE